jgi:hypothetical protein
VEDLGCRRTFRLRTLHLSVLPSPQRPRASFSTNDGDSSVRHDRSVASLQFLQSNTGPRGPVAAGTVTARRRCRDTFYLCRFDNAIYPPHFSPRRLLAVRSHGNDEERRFSSMISSFVACRLHICCTLIVECVFFLQAPNLLFSPLASRKRNSRLRWRQGTQRQLWRDQSGRRDVPPRVRVVWFAGASPCPLPTATATTSVQTLSPELSHCLIRATAAQKGAFSKKKEGIHNKTYGLHPSIYYIYYTTTL